MDTLLDETIIAKCNELLQLKQRTVRTRVQRQNERAHTQRALERAKRDLDGRQQQLRFTKDLSRYQQALRDDDNDDDDTKVMPPLAAARQSQLCLHVHVMTVLENQLELLRQQHRDELLRLEQQVKLHREGIAETEVQVLNDMVAVQQEIRDFVEWTQEPLVKRKQQKKQQRQEQLEREQKKKQQEEEEEEEEMPTSPAKEEEDDDNQPNAVGSPSTKPKKVRFRSTTTPPHRRQSTGGLLPNDNNNDENRSALLGERQTSAPKLSQSSEGLKRMMMPSRPSSLTKISMIH